MSSSKRDAEFAIVMDLEQGAYDVLVADIATILSEGRKKVAVAINNVLVETYWNIGRVIVEYEQGGNIKAEYGSQLLEHLSRDLSKQFGKGFNRSNIFTMRKLYVSFPKIQTVSGFLSWSHYIEILKADNELERNFYIKECEKSKWSVRELQRQMKSMLFYRIAASKDKETVMALAMDGQQIMHPEDIIRDPYVLEFAGLPELSVYKEGDLQLKMQENMKSFLLELGRGFAFIKEQYRIPISGKNFHVDLVFYNCILKCYVLIDLKRGMVEHEDIGQMNLYLNYFKHEVCSVDDNLPIGIVLGANKDDLIMEYATEGITNQVFVAKYQLYLPRREEIQARLDKIMGE